MSEEVERLGLMVELHELALARLFETAPGGAQARQLFVADLRRLRDATAERQPGSPAAQTYAALLRRLRAAGPDDPELGVAPTPERGLPPAGSGA